MNAFRIRAVFAAYSPEAIRFVLVSDKSKRSIEEDLTSKGWTEIVIRGATAGDLEELKTLDEMMQGLASAISERSRRQQEAKAAAAQRREKEIELHRRVNERLEADRKHKARQAAQAVASDILQARIESSSLAREEVRVICIKLGMFLDETCGNRREIYNLLISAAATAQSRLESIYPVVVSVIGDIVRSMNTWFQMEAVMFEAQSGLQHEAAAVDADIRSVASRSYVYGGSGAGLLFSALAADSAVREDKAHVDRMRRQFQGRVDDVESFCRRAIAEQATAECRLHVAHAAISPPGSPSRSLDMPERIAAAVIGSARG